MKYIRLNIIALALTSCCLTLSSCLDEDPKGSLQDKNANMNATTLEINTVAEIYNYIGGNEKGQGLQGTERGIYDLNTFSTDEAMLPTRGGDWYDGGLWQDLYLHTWKPSLSILNTSWKFLYKVIFLCNKHIATLDEKKDLLSPERYQADRAELRAVRAMFYFYTMDLFGRVPLMTNTDTDVSKVVLNKRSEVFQFIIKELQEAAPFLNKEHSNMEGDYYGRMTQPVVHFLLAKLMLNAEVYTNDNWTGNTRPDGKTLTFDTPEGKKNAWEACIYYCELIKNEGYQLEDDFTFNFSRHNERSKENIFTIPMDKMLYKNQFQYLFRSRHYAHGAALGMDAWNGTSATLSTVKAFGYNTEDVDSRWDLCFYYGPLFVNDKPVMLEDGTQLNYDPLSIKLDLTGIPNDDQIGARMKKYETDKTAYADGKLQSNDIVLFRYADVLLMEAEAKARNGQDGSAEFNQVRMRVNMPAINLSSLTTHLSPITEGVPGITPQLSAILRERLLELVWEGWRRNDLVRFGVFHRAYDQREQASGEADAHTIVFPIPSDAINLIPGAVQNPGY